MKRSRFPLIEVLWMDSVQLEGGAWMDIEGVQESLAQEDMLHRTVGMLVGESKHALAIGRSISEYPGEHVEKAEGVFLIPKACVLERKERQ